MFFAVRKMQHVIVKTVFVVPEGASACAYIVHGVRDVDEMLEEFARHILVGDIFFCQLQRDGQHIEAIHAHPACAVGLFQVAAGGERRGTIEDPNIVKTQKAALEDVHSFRVFTVDPPGEVEKQLVKDSFEKSAIGSPQQAAIEFANAPSNHAM